MVRKGGFGVAAGISLFFFLIYWAFLIGGEKLSERGFFSPIYWNVGCKYSFRRGWNYSNYQNK